MYNLKPILLIEDDDVDTMTVKRALGELKVENELVCKGNGEEALDYLRGGSDTEPSLVLLDLNMPKMNGFEFLKVLKSDGVLRRIPVVVLTTSKEESDVVASFDYGAAGYMVKPVDYKRFLETIDVINRYWTLSKLPDGE